MQPHLEPDGHGPGMLLLSSLASRFVYTRETAESSSLCCKIWHFTPDSYTLFAMLWLVLICCERKVLLAAGWFSVREKYCSLYFLNGEQDVLDRPFRTRFNVRHQEDS